MRDCQKLGLCEELRLIQISQWVVGYLLYVKIGLLGWYGKVGTLSIIHPSQPQMRIFLQHAFLPLAGVGLEGHGALFERLQHVAACGARAAGADARPGRNKRGAPEALPSRRGDGMHR